MENVQQQEDATGPQATLAACKRIVIRNYASFISGKRDCPHVFTLTQIYLEEQDNIVREAGLTTSSPKRSIAQHMQKLRDDHDFVAFVDYAGTYILKGSLYELSKMTIEHCNSIQEEKIAKKLEKLQAMTEYKGKFTFKRQKTFPECKNHRCDDGTVSKKPMCCGMVYKNPLRYDFLIEFSDHNCVALEFHGIQHFRSFRYMGGFKGFIYRCINDEIKRVYADDHFFDFVMFSYLQTNKLMGLVKGLIDKYLTYL